MIHRPSRSTSLNIGSFAGNKGRSPSRGSVAFAQGGVRFEEPEACSGRWLPGRCWDVQSGESESVGNHLACEAVGIIPDPGEWAILKAACPQDPRTGFPAIPILNFSLLEYIEADTWNALEGGMVHPQHRGRTGLVG